MFSRIMTKMKSTLFFIVFCKCFSINDVERTNGAATSGVCAHAQYGTSQQVPDAAAAMVECQTDGARRGHYVSCYKSWPPLEEAKRKPSRTYPTDKQRIKDSFLVAARYETSSLKCFLCIMTRVSLYVGERR